MCRRAASVSTGSARLPDQLPGHRAQTKPSFPGCGAAVDGPAFSQQGTGPSPSNAAATRPRPWGRSGLGPRTHATGRLTAKHRRRASRANPARPHDPDLAAAWMDHRQQDRVDHIACRATTDHAGLSWICHGRRQSLVLPGRGCGVGQGRYARRGGNRVDTAEPRRVLACRALNGPTASAWPPRCLDREDPLQIAESVRCSANARRRQRAWDALEPMGLGHFSGPHSGRLASAGLGTLSKCPGTRRRRSAGSGR